MQSEKKFIITKIITIKIAEVKSNIITKIITKIISKLIIITISKIITNYKIIKIYKNKKK